jgi:hypothetical protein
MHAGLKYDGDGDHDGGGARRHSILVKALEGPACRMRCRDIIEEWRMAVCVRHWLEKRTKRR